MVVIILPSWGQGGVITSEMNGSNTINKQIHSYP